MRIRRTTTFIDEEPMVSELPLDMLYEKDQVRIGFEQGTLKAATFEWTNGQTTIYEQVEENV